MISPTKMLVRIASRLAKDRKAKVALREALAVSRKHTKRLREQLKAARGLDALRAAALRETVKELKAFRKAQLRLPL